MRVVHLVFASRRLRFSALLAGAAVIVASVLPAFPAAAEEPPSAPVVTSEPVADPAPEATETAEPEPTFAPPAPDAPTTDDVEYSGTFSEIAHEPGGDSSKTQLFQVDGYGFLAVDASRLTSEDLLGTQNVTFEIPNGTSTSGGAQAQFDKLAAASVADPLTITSVEAGLSDQQYASMVNQTPNAEATHRIYAVLVSPNNKSKGSNQTAAKVQTSVDHLDDYWAEQSGGTIGFDLVGVTSWYKTSTKCSSVSSSISLWNKAASVAKSKLGYVAGKNNHLVVFFPDNDAICGGPVGLGSIGDSANTGGISWVIGTDSLTAQATLTHEVGHNLSLGHADWLDCDSPKPIGGFIGFGGSTGCDKRDYGDIVDVMGFARNNRDGGALSSPQAIRSGIWADDAWATAEVGDEQEFVLSPVSANTGLRAVVVQDDDGVNYFVEFRDFSGEDAQFAADAGTCVSQYCVADAPGVRIMRLENNAHMWSTSSGISNGFLGFPGDDSFLIGRTVSDQRVGYTAGDTFYSKGTAGIFVEVTGITATAATVRITKDADPVTTQDPGFRVFFSSTYDTKKRVGDTWTALVGAKHDATTTSFQWYRIPCNSSTGTPISGANMQNYTLRADDLGSCLGVVMNGVSSPIYGPIVTGVYQVDQPGSVYIFNATTPLEAVTTADWPDFTTFTYQWYRGSSATKATNAISGADEKFYTPTTADIGQFLRVRVTASPPGFDSVSRYSEARDLSIRNTTVPTLSGSPQVGFVLTGSLASDVYGSPAGGPLAGVTPSYQWLRDGKPITGNSDATDNADYTLQGLDYGKKIQLRVTGSKPGFVPNVVTSAATKVIHKGAFAYGPVPIVTASGRKLTVAVSTAADVVPAADKYTVQWYRDDVKIKKATKASYTLSSADYGKTVVPKITYTGLGREPITQMGQSSGFSNRWGIEPHFDDDAITGNPAVGNTLGAGAATNYYNPQNNAYPTVGATDPQQQYQWLRDGKALKGKTSYDYTPTSADKGHQLSVRITTTSDVYPYLLPFVRTTAKTQKLGSFGFDDWDDPPTVALAGDVLTAIPQVDSPTPTSWSYQWYRGGNAVSGADQKEYTLSQFDYGWELSVKVTSKLSGYTPAVGQSEAKQYGIHGPNLTYNVFPQSGTYGDPIHVGDTIETDRPPFTDGTFTEWESGDSVHVDSTNFTYEWYRDGKRITGLDPYSNTYVVQPDDLGKIVSAAIRVHVTGYADYVRPSRTAVNPFQKVVAGSFNLGTLHPTVSVGTNKVATVAFAGSPVSPALPYSYKYKWLRSGKTIKGQTKSTYKLTSSDTGKLVEVLVTVSKTGYVSHPWDELPVNQVVASGGTATVGGTLFIDQPVTCNAPSYALAWGTPVVLGTNASATYKWFRNGTPISGATSASYIVKSADLDTDVHCTLTVSASAHAKFVDVSPTVHIPA